MNYDHAAAGRIIRKLRKERGMSQETLSGLASIGRSHLAMIESGSKNASVDTLWRIAKALDMRLSELIAVIESEMEE